MRLFPRAAPILLAALMAAPVAPAAEPLAEVAAPGWEKLDPIVEAGITAKVYPGAVLVVGQPGKVLRSRAYGKLTYAEDAAPMQMNTVFDLASVSKVVGTTTGAMILVEDGVISPDDLASKYIPGFEANGKETVTVRDLMTHTSGLKAYENKDTVESLRQPGQLNADALIARYAALKTSYEPRTKSVYSCLNFQTTARIVENASGRRLEDLLRERVFGPLGMVDTTYLPSKEALTRTAPTIERKDGTPLVGIVHDPLAAYHGSDAHCPGNAGVFSTAADVARWCEMIANEGALGDTRVFKPETVRLFTTTQSPANVDAKRGLGFDVWDSKPYTTDLNQQPADLIVGHTGYTGTLVWIDKKTKTYMVFFTNRTFPDDATKGKDELSIATVRKQLCDAVLHGLPEYTDYFAGQTAAGSD